MVASHRDPYELRFYKRFQKDLNKLPASDQVRVLNAVNALAQTPRPPGCKKIVGTIDAWRIRVGDYRILYEIHDHILLLIVLRLGHRRDVYD